jgi:ankyrin repeat protein
MRLRGMLQCARSRIPLHVAVELKHLKVVVRLLENSSHVYTNALGYQEARSSPDVNAQDLKGWTSLHYAALTGDMDICTGVATCMCSSRRDPSASALCLAGADPSILAFDSTSVFQGCSSHDCFRIMSVTLKEQQLTEQLKKVAEKMSRAQSLASFEHLRSKTSCAICDTNRNLNAAQS